MFTISSRAFDSRLTVVQDGATHCTIQPTDKMSYETYNQLLKETRLRWVDGDAAMTPQIERRDEMIAAVEGQNGFDSSEQGRQASRLRGRAVDGPHERPRSDPGVGLGRK